MDGYRELWKLTLRVYEVAQTKASLDHIYISLVDQEYIVTEKHNSNTLLAILISEEKFSNSKVVIRCTKPFNFQILENAFFDSKSIEFLSVYLPYALLPHFSKKMNKVFVISHFAQTLDGRIASQSGDSKWIGNNENLTHAHRMRALSDGIGVGSETLKIDQPSLNVRHVEGDNPIKVIIGNSNQNGSLGTILEEEVLFINHESLGTVGSRNKHCDIKEITHYLRKHKIGTFYLEGGAVTSSRFLKENCIDQIQIHISPKILGSGKVGFQFEGIDTMSESIQFSTHRFLPVGDQIMFIGEL